MRTKSAVVASLIIVTMFATLFMPANRVSAFIPEPYELYGVARQETSVVLPNGEPIRTFVDGVDYSNKTSVFSRPAQTDGFFDVDTFGNYKTNGSDPGTPWIKEGADDNETIMYVWGSMSNDTQLDVTKPWLTGIVFEEAHDWQTGLAPQAGDLNAAPAALQPPLIKIQTIVVNSADPPANPTDYVWLCNPTPATVDASQFYLTKDVPGSTTGPIVTIPAGETIAPYGKYYLDTGDVNWFVATGDNVKLVWNNTPGANAPFAGNDIIVDRVEFNASAGGTLFWEPGNTIQRDEIAPGNGFQINRSATCRDTNSRVQDFFLQPEGLRQNKKPLAPWPMTFAGLSSTVNDSRVFHITQLTNIPITWTHNDPDVPPHAQQQANVIVSLNPGQSGIVFTTVVNGPANSATITTTLLPCTTYYYSVKTKDSEWSDYWAEWRVHTNCRPGGLNLLSPTSGSTVPSPVTLTWTAVTDGDAGDLANYTWQIDDEITFAAPLVATGTTQSTQTIQTLTPGTYYWRVNASDGWESISYTSPWQFTIASADANPTVTNVSVAGYRQGAAELMHIIDRTPDFGWEFHDVNPSDTQARYHVVLRLASDDSLIWEQNQTGAAQLVTYPGTPALTDGETYYIRVAVQDSSTSGLWSTWTTALNFRINTPPATPTLASPANGATPTPGDVTLTWNAVTADPEGDTLTYEYCVDITNPPTACGVHTGTTTSTSAPAFTAADGTQYFWQVRVSDGYETSAWSTVWSFTPSSIPPNTPPTITITSQPGDLVGQSTFTITWTMQDNETSQANLIVLLTYRIGTGLPLPITTLTGQTSHPWTIPDIDASNVVIIALVTDEGGLTDIDQTASFTIAKKTEQPVDMTVWIILIVIIIVVVILVLVLLMRRKKPKEAEAEAPAGEAEIGEMEEEEMVEEAAPAAAPARAAAKAPGKTLECPSCGTVVAATDKECFMCGAKL